MRVPSLVLLGVTAVALSGCALFGKTDRQVLARSVQAVGPADEPDAELARGRQALEEARFADAIAAFSALRHDAVRAGEAFNGLAIAYAGLGRPDLAERFFRQAIASSPADRRFHANLARFYAAHPASSYRLARQETEQPVAAVPASAALESQPGRLLPGDRARASIRIDLAAQTMVRVSPREVVVGTRLAEANGRRVNPNFPVRIDLADRTVETDSSAYPVRVSLANGQK